MMKNSKLKFSEYMQNISSSKSFGRFVLIVGVQNWGSKRSGLKYPGLCWIILQPFPIAILQEFQNILLPLHFGKVIKISFRRFNHCVYQYIRFCSNSLEINIFNHISYYNSRQILHSIKLNQ